MIYRNYTNDYNIEVIKKIKKYCKKANREFYISNNLKVALMLNLSGLYIPAFYRLTKFKNLNIPKNFKFIGSAHNLRDIKVKENQGCEEIFLAPIFKTRKNKTFLDILRFNLIALNTRKKIIALGGVNLNNLKKISLTRSIGFASITWLKKNQPKKI